MAAGELTKSKSMPPSSGGAAAAPDLPAPVLGARSVSWIAFLGASAVSSAGKASSNDGLDAAAGANAASRSDGGWKSGEGGARSSSSPGSGTAGICFGPCASPGSGTTLCGGGVTRARPGFSAGGGADCIVAEKGSVPGSGTAALVVGFLPDPAARAPAGLPAGDVAEPGSGTEPFASPALGLCTVNGVLHFGHLMESPAGGTRLSSSS